MQPVQMEWERKRAQFWLKPLTSSLFILSAFSVVVFAGAGRQSDGRYAIFEGQNTSYTHPTSINDRGEVTGYLIGYDNRVRGFVRRLNGEIEIFDATAGGTDTDPVDINDRGEVAGDGFLRDSGGRITLFNAPGALPGQTLASGINARGSIAGRFMDHTLPLEHGYVRDPSGRITTFDIPNSSHLLVSGINAKGDIDGTFEDWTDSGKQRIFVRDQKGLFTFYDIPDGTPWVSGINDRGEIAGIYVLPSTEGNVTFGFYRDSGGAVTDLGIPNPEVTGLNSHGEVVGIFSNAEKGGKTCGFIWRARGKTTILDFPEGTATYAYSINDRGQVAGSIDVAGLGSRRRGFVYTEHEEADR